VIDADREHLHVVAVFGEVVQFLHLGMLGAARVLIRALYEEVVAFRFGARRARRADNAG
jgi:hypothetical protein